MAGPIAAGALRIGASITRSAKLFKRGIDSSTEVGGGTVKATIRKISQTNSKIKVEKKKQARFDREVRERMAQRAKESGLENKKLSKASGSLLTKVIKKPLDALVKLLMAWVVDNLPRLIKMVENTGKRIRIFSAALKSTFTQTGSVIRSLGAIVVAYAKNIATFDFNDSKGRVKKAQAEYEENVDGLKSSFGEMKEVWGREEEDLDKILTSLESGESLTNSLKAVDEAFKPDAVEVTPTTSAVGPGSAGPGSGGKNKWGMSTETATNTKWRPILDLIASAESVDGSYDSAYPSKTIPGLSNMSIAEAIQASGGQDSQGRNLAIGRYQFTTADKQAAAVGLKSTDKFSPENQDKMAIGLIEGKREVSMDRLRTDPYGAQMELAKEWAGLAAPDTQKSYYDGDKVNASSRTTADITGAFSETLNPPKQESQAATPNTQQPQPAGSQTGADARGMTLGNKLTSSDFNTTDRSVPSPIIKTSGFGMRNGRMHRGIDFAPPDGTRGWYCGLNVNGKVSFIGTDSGYGKFVMVQVGNVDLLFGHLEQISPGIRVGTKYTAGQPIGEVGSTGRSSGTHLHFEARPAGGGGGTGYNPEPYVKHLIFGKLQKKTNAQKVSMNGNSGAKSDQIASAAASNRTGAGSRTHSSTTVIGIQPILT